MLNPFAPTRPLYGANETRYSVDLDEKPKTRISEDWFHRFTRCAKNYIHFTCSAQPNLKLVSAKMPLRCPVCRSINPLRLKAEEV